MNVTCPKDLFKNELLFIQELQELGISIIMNVTCPKDLFKNELLSILELQELEIFNYHQRHERHLT